MASGQPAETTSLEPITSRSLSGHIGHLSPAQQQALADFKQQLEQKGYYRPSAEGKEASHDDNTLVRFLRARKFDLAGAISQFTTSEDWRKTQNVDDLYDHFPLEEYAQSAALYTQWTGRRDRSGLPVYVFKVSALSKEKTDEYIKAGAERLEQRMFVLFEHMLQFVLPFCNAVPHAHQETSISGCITIVDVSGVSLRRFWQLKDHMQRASVLASARYPETLGAIFLVGAPGFFSTVWSWVKKWFDPGTVEKIHILPSSPSAVRDILTTHLPASSIPKVYGGELDWEFGAPGPSLGEEEKKVLGREEVPAGPVRWDAREKRLRVVGKGRADSEIVDDSGASAELGEAKDAGAPGAAEARPEPVEGAATNGATRVDAETGTKETFVTPPTSPSELVAETGLEKRLEAL